MLKNMFSNGFVYFEQSKLGISTCKYWFVKGFVIAWETGKTDRTEIIFQFFFSFMKNTRIEI